MYDIYIPQEAEKLCPLGVLILERENFEDDTIKGSCDHEGCRSVY
jgi:hypothetical protein